jgi:hypothetical protein
MRYTTILFLLLSISSCGQGTLTDQREKERLGIESQITADKLILLVKVMGQADLKKVIDQNWPDDIETTYNIFKNQRGQIIYLGEFPTANNVHKSWRWDIKVFNVFS